MSPEISHFEWGRTLVGAEEFKDAKLNQLRTSEPALGGLFHSTC